MTFVNCGVAEWPRADMAATELTTGGANGTVTLDSTTDCLYWVGRSPIADSLSKIYFRTGIIPAAGGDTIDIRIETVANGRRTGTLWAANTNATVAIADSDDNLWKTATLTAAASLTVGAEFAIVIASSAGTPSIVLTLSHNTVNVNGIGNYPIVINNLTGADAVIDGGNPQWIAEFVTAGLKHLPGLSPIDGVLTLSAFTNATATHERALRFKSTVPRRIIGMRAFIGNVAAGANFTFSLWDASGTTDAAVLGQATIDGDYPSSTTVDAYCDLYFATPVSISKDTEYFAGVRADTANSLTLFEASTAGTGEPANAIKTMSHESLELYLATRTWAAGTASAWTTTTTTFPMISLIYDQLDDGAGGGGGSNMSRVQSGH